MTTPAETRLMAGVAADLLEVGRSIDAASRIVTAAVMLAGAVLMAGGGPLPLLAAIAAALALGLAETVLAARVAFDAALFRRLSGETGGDTPDLRAFDAVMGRLGLLPAAKTGRPMDQRIAGARRLLTLQGAAFAAQVAVPGLALTVGGLLP